ncbi:hypothetical protein HY212_06990 [Candidatus Pacearchaeota archaeon]|nr:hypothetical protein [Candidatus Pacearchaeota archaeon]
MKNEEMMKELEDKFSKMKKELGLKTSLDDLDRNFYLKDYILKEGFISENLIRQVSYRIVETFMSWNEYLHSLIMPNPQNMLNLSESKVLSQEDKKEITELIKKGMEIGSRNSVINLSRNKKQETMLIEDAVKLWETEFKPELSKIMTKINKEWKESG